MRLNYLKNKNDSHPHCFVSPWNHCTDERRKESAYECMLVNDAGAHNCDIFWGDCWGSWERRKWIRCPVPASYGWRSMVTSCFHWLPSQRFMLSTPTNQSGLGIIFTIRDSWWTETQSAISLKCSAAPVIFNSQLKLMIEGELNMQN